MAAPSKNVWKLVGVFVVMGFMMGFGGILLEVIVHTNTGLFFVLGSILCGFMLAIAGIFATYAAKLQTEEKMGQPPASDLRQASPASPNP